MSTQRRFLGNQPIFINGLGTFHPGEEPREIADIDLPLLSAALFEDVSEPEPGPEPMRSGLPMARRGSGRQGPEPEVETTPSSASANAPAAPEEET